MPTFKKIKDYTAQELDDAVTNAIVNCENAKVIPTDPTYRLSFWAILNGIDAYFERRKRKEELEQASKDEKHDKEFFSSQD